VGKGYRIVDRDTKYCAKFRQMFARDGIRVIRPPPRSTNLNAHAERFVRSLKEECLLKLIPIGRGMLRCALHEYVAHHHLERDHQGLGNERLTPRLASERRHGRISQRLRLGGNLNDYERLAA
jgi:transposase InsO family protein